jgi:hypothetical protein
MTKTKRSDKPTGPVARALEGALTYLDGRVHKPAGDEGPKTPGLNLAKLERELNAALLRDQAGSTTADGFPRGGEGGSPDETKLTAVEAAASSRIAADKATAQRRRALGHDPVHEHTMRALRSVLDAVELLQVAEAAMVAITRLTSEAPLDSPACDLCTEHGLSNPRPWDTFGTVGGRLPKQLHLCRTHRFFIEDNGRPPTADETKQHDRTGKWKLRATA